MDNINKEERIDEFTMRITRRSMMNGGFNTRDLLITEKQWRQYCSGVLIQVAFPGMSASDREFIMTGITDEEWDAVFKSDK